MKVFIRNRLKILLEGRMSSHTPSNPSGVINKRDTTQADINRARADIANAIETYKSLSDEQKKELGGVYDGDGKYEVKLSTNGDLAGKPNWMGKNAAAAAGTYNDPNPSKRYFYVMANRGVSHPEYDDATRSGYIVGKSPMADAILKVRFFMGVDIINFLEGSTGYDDGKGEEIKKAKQDPYWDYKDERREKEKQREKTKGQLTMDPDKASLFDDIQKVKQERSKLIKSKGDRAKIGELSKHIELLSKKYENI